MSLYGVLFFIMMSCALAAPLPTTQSSPRVENPPGASIDLPAPIGEDMKGIIIPQYDSEGHLVMNFMAEKARKIDELHVEITSLKIGFFEKQGKDVTVLVPHGIFDLETKILSADSLVTIKREDFEMVGDSATFDTAKRSGTMKGHVHTEIRNGAPAEGL